MIGLSFVISFLVPSFFSASALAQGLTLPRYIEEVEKSHPGIQANRLRALALEYKIDPARTLEDPFVAVGIDEIPFEGGGAELRRYQISQSIPFFGKLGTRGEIAERKAQSAKFESDSFSRQIRVMATQVFLRTWYNKENIRLNKKLQAVLEEVSSSAKARYRTGDNVHHEWLLAKVELSSLKVEFLRLQREETTLIALLNELRNLPPATPVEISPQEVSPDETVPEADLDTQPELQTLRTFSQAAENELKLAKLSYAPDFVLQGMAMEPTSGNMSQINSNWGVMVGVTLPLYFWRKQNDLVAAAEKDRQAAALELRGLENRLRTEVTDAGLRYKTALDVVELYKTDVIPLTEIAVKNARSAYASKTLPLRQLLEVLKSQKTQELEFLAAKIDVSLSKLRITELLSSPPLLRFAPARPTMFGESMTGAMGLSSDMGGSATINMGSGLSGPTRKQNESSRPSGMPGGM